MSTGQIAGERRLADPRWVGLLVFVLALAVATAVVGRSERRDRQERRDEVRVLVQDKAHALIENIQHSLSATYVLAALVRQGNGEVRGFDDVAGSMLPNFPGVAALQLAPAGVIRHVVPLAGNEAAIGHDLFADPERNLEARLARDQGRLTLAGPFPLIQGGLGAVGRLPVYLPDAFGEMRFWGFTSVLMRLPGALMPVQLERLGWQGMRYELWRVNPDNGARQTFVRSDDAPLVDPVDYDFSVASGTWVLSAEPEGGWQDTHLFALKVLVGLLSGVLLGWLAARFVALSSRSGALQQMVAERNAELLKLSTAVAFSPASIVITDRNGAIEYVNPQFERVTGYTMAEAVGQNPRILKSGKRTPEEYQRLWQTITAGEVWRGDFENVRKDGSHYWESAAIAPLRDTAGEITGFVAVKEDITARRAAELLLRESRARLAALVESLPDTLFVIDRTGCIVEYRCAQPELLLVPPEQFLGQPYAEVMPPAVVERIDGAIAAIEGGDSPQQIEYTLDLPDGARHFNASLSALPGPDGALSGVIGLVRDMTERRRDAEALRQAMVVFRASSQGIMTTDAHGVITSVNPAFCAITGYEAAEVLGHKSSIFKSGRHDEAFFQAMWETLVDQGAWEGEIWNRRKNGETYPQWLTITAVCNAEGEVVEYVSLFSDITERKRQEAAIWHQANFDPLTGLANRSLLQDRLVSALAQARRLGGHVGLMFIDLDGFKWINDSLGHDVGDGLLVEVAHRLSGCVREQDTVARLGGDEFTVVVQDLGDPDMLRPIAEKLIQVLREPFQLGSTRHHLSGSIGITVFPEDGGDVQTLLRNADIAMYKAKQAGKNRIQFYAQHMQADALARLKVESELRVALEHGHFVLHFQPIVDARSGALVAAEALIRWRHPERGMVAPGDFIPVAEDSGLIVPVGEWALREAVRQAVEWRDAGYPALRISVNVSGVQFREPGLPELVDTLLEASGVARDRLMLEITESVLMESSDAAEARMHAVRAQGVGYALDDFGTGFSSLSYLKRFPVDSVKIDRSFVRDCPQDASDAGLVEAIINMAHSLGLRVTAEGVETAEQLEFLRGLGCDFIQGYFIGRPMPAEDFAAQMGPLWTLETPATRLVTA